MTTDMLLTFSLLLVTIILFVSDKLRVDVVAILIMIALPWLGILAPREALSGLSSNAVVSIIAVMILGHGVDRTGIMNRITRPVLGAAEKSEPRLLGLVSATVGVVSAFMQNIGAAALFLPSVMRISKKLKVPASRLLMPMGFAAILGGTLTMIASSPLIMLNDLLRQGGEPAFGLFSVTPVGMALLISGVAYFLLFGKWVLPGQDVESEEGSPQEELIKAWGLLSSMHCVSIPAESRLNGKILDEIGLWDTYNLHVVVMREQDEVHYAPWRNTRIQEGQRFGLLGSKADVEHFVSDNGLHLEDKQGSELEELESGEAGGFAEIVLHPRSALANKSMREIALRRKYGIEPLLLMSGSTIEHHDFSDQKLKPGDTLVVYGYWDRFQAIKEDKNLILLTPIQAEESKPSKQWSAICCFLGAIGLAIAGFPLSISLLSGAIAMILLKVITMDEAYKSIDWRTVFLLAGLIPLGLAMEKTGAAAFVADRMAEHLTGAHALVIMGAVAVLTTVFSLFMSNVAAAVLLVPLVMILGQKEGIDPRGLALLVAVCASNSFLLPTHQVNALLMAPGGYHNRDYLRAGGMMTVIFVIVSVAAIYMLYIAG
jgi:di/tricarboxylate transporter